MTTRKKSETELKDEIKANASKVWMAGLGALFVLVGQLLGGTNGAIGALVFAVLLVGAVVAVVISIGGLVEIAPLAEPPVCKMMDFGKFKYREAKKAHEARQKQKQSATSSTWT